jgi:predicted enzyme related to lactoylglutathione lyase
MIERATYPPGVPCWVELETRDPGAARAFYGGLLGWQFEDDEALGAVARLRGLTVAGVRRGGGEEAAWITSVRVERADDAARRVTEAGGHVLTAPHDVGDAGRAADVADPAGALLRLWEPRRHPGAQLVNAPGSWNSSDLLTTDLDAAAAFYGAVFGWEASDLGEGSALWRLPGYGDFLEELDPGMRERHADAGAPEGFADAVGWLLPLQDPGERPRWSVTFSVDDPDAAARGAEALGGAVVVEPFVAPPVRLAVLRDPAGTTFTVGHYAPERYV